MSSVRVRGALPAVLADGFGPEAAFTPLVAELDGSVVGYAFFSAGYNTDETLGADATITPLSAPSTGIPVADLLP